MGAGAELRDGAEESVAVAAPAPPWRQAKRQVRRADPQLLRRRPVRPAEIFKSFPRLISCKHVYRSTQKFTGVQEETSQNFTRRLERLKFELGWTDERLSKEIVLSRRMLYLMRTGKASITRKTLYKLQKLEEREGLNSARGIQAGEQRSIPRAELTRRQYDNGSSVLSPRADTKPSTSVNPGENDFQRLQNMVREKRVGYGDLSKDELREIVETMKAVVERMEQALEDKKK